MNLLPSDKPGRSWRIKSSTLGQIGHEHWQYYHILHKHFSMMDNVVVLIQPLPDVMNCHQDSVLKRISGCLSTLTPSWKRLKLHDDEKACWNFLLLTIHYDPVEAYVSLWVCYWVLVMGTHDHGLQYWDFRPSQVVSRFYSRQLLVCKHEIAWVSIPKMCQTMGFWWFLGFQTFFENSMDFPAMFQIACSRVPMGAQQFFSLRRRRLLPPCLTPWIRVGGVSESLKIVGYADCSRVNKSISQLYGILI